MTVKKEYSSVDAQPIVLNAKTDPNSQNAYPVLATSSGCLLISSGMDIPAYDSIIISYSSGNISNVYYYIGGTAGTIVATLTLSYSVGNLVNVARS